MSVLVSTAKNCAATAIANGGLAAIRNAADGAPAPADWETLEIVLNRTATTEEKQEFFLAWRRAMAQGFEALVDEAIALVNPSNDDCDCGATAALRQAEEENTALRARIAHLEEVQTALGNLVEQERTFRRVIQKRLEIVSDVANKVRLAAMGQDQMALTQTILWLGFAVEGQLLKDGDSYQTNPDPLEDARREWFENFSKRVAAVERLLKEPPPGFDLPCPPVEGDDP